MRKDLRLSLPQFAFVVATRAALGAGVGLLASTRLCKKTRKRAGATLLTIGAVTTLPALWFVFGRKDREGEYTPTAAAS